MKKRRYAINFDLDTKRLSQYFNNPSQAYSKLEKEFKKNGFSHIQGSGYVSIKGLSKTALYQAIMAIYNQNNWLLNCSKDIRITQVIKVYDGKKLLNKLIQIQSQTNTILTATPGSEKSTSKADNTIQIKLPDSAKITSYGSEGLKIELKEGELAGFSFFYHKKLYKQTTNGREIKVHKDNEFKVSNNANQVYVFKPMDLQKAMFGGPITANLIGSTNNISQFGNKKQTQFD